jgi:hypothetical protein
VSSLLAVDASAAALSPIAPQRIRAPLGVRTASAQWHMQRDTWQWEPAFFDIYGVRAEEVVPGASALLAMKHPDDLAMLTALLQGVKMALSA